MRPIWPEGFNISAVCVRVVKLIFKIATPPTLFLITLAGGVCARWMRSLLWCQVVLSREGELIYLGTQSVLLQTGLLLTKVEYPATPQQPVFVTGRVEFFDVPDTDGRDGDTRRDEVQFWTLTQKIILNILPFIA